MDAIGLHGESDVQTVIHNDACTGLHVCHGICNAMQHAARERAALSRGEVFLADLDPIDASRRGRCDFA
jgi:hypothetical protein